MVNQQKVTNFMKVYKTIQSVNNLIQFDACEKMIEVYTRLEIGLGTPPTEALQKQALLHGFLTVKQSEFTA